MSHPFKLPGIALYDSLQEIIDSITLFREKEEHEILQLLESTLRNSVEDAISIAGDIAQAEAWVQDITDILLGKLDMQGNRNTEDYKKKMTSDVVQQKLSTYILSLAKIKEEYSPFLQKVLKHFRTIHNNWNKYLFTCYTHTFLPNTNLELELSHSRMKRTHRRITGLKNSHHFLLIHGEHFSFCFDPDYSYDTLILLLQSVDYEKVRQKSQKERIKSTLRGKKRMSLKNLSKTLLTMLHEWGN